MELKKPAPPEYLRFDKHYDAIIRSGSCNPLIGASSQILALATQLWIAPMVNSTQLEAEIEKAVTQFDHDTRNGLTPTSKVFDDAKYCLCAHLDLKITESLSGANWQLKTLRKLIASDHPTDCNNRARTWRGGEEFFLICREYLDPNSVALRFPWRADFLELLRICLELGFLGQFIDPPGVSGYKGRWTSLSEVKQALQNAIVRR